MDKYAEVHKHIQGPGDARPTALQIIQDEGLEGKLTDRVVFITGCSSGIGIETARALYATGAVLYLANRDTAKTKSALSDIVDSDRVHLLDLDLMSLDSVRACADRFLSQSKTLNIFIANAAIMASPEGRTNDGFETQFGVNHLGHFLLFQLLAPTLLASARANTPSRAIFVSSGSHRNLEPKFGNLTLEGEYNPFLAYGASKTANIWTANEIERRYGARGLHAFSVYPGGILTGLQAHFPDDLKKMMEQYVAQHGKSLEQGAATTVWAATAKALEGKGGIYLEDCQVGKQWEEKSGRFGPGYAAWAFDEAKEGRIWEVSMELVGLGEGRWLYRVFRMEGERLDSKVHVSMKE
jgi:NAD(P)-dependent dehydrogenase (short-subunit alcohol dehydrogenase family)